MATRSILIVEPDPNVRSLIKQSLEELGIKIETAVDGAQALICLGREHFNLVLSEINLPYLSGLKLIEILKVNDISTPVIIMTDDYMADNEVHALSLGAVDFIRKPFNRTVFIQRINSALKEKS